MGPITVSPCVPQPALVAGEWPGESPTLGCPLRGGAAQGLLGRALCYLLVWGERGFGCRGAGLRRGAPSTDLGQWVLHPGEAPAPAGRSCRASLLTPFCLLSSRNAPGT